jgi:hypothetical protein
MLSPKVQHALSLVRQGETWKRAAAIAGCHESSIAKAVGKKICPHCGQTIVKKEKRHA